MTPSNWLGRVNGSFRRAPRPFSRAGDCPKLPWLAFLVAMFAGSALITANSLVYFDFDAVAPFVIERLPERFASLWLAALQVHVAAALVSLPLCLALTFR